MDDTARIIDILRERFPEIQGPRKDDICYATQNRQDAVKRLASAHDLILVVGSPNSSNSNRLRELAERLGSRAYLIDGPQQIDPVWVNEATAIAVTAGASAPENIVRAVCERLRELGADTVSQEHGVDETVQFSLPKELRLRLVE
jgi:4-hydroxy-3-methylbut-2-enyl diphosphate reductase